MTNIVFASTAAEWRAWLTRNCHTEREAWLVIHHKDTGIPSLRIHEAVEHALCFGWIDGLHRKRDAHSSQLRFTPRTPRSTWSHINRQRAARMIELGLMTEPGQAAIDRAKTTGTWQPVPSTIPADLQQQLNRNKPARANFDNFPPSSKRLILEWIATAKRPETRQRRITQTVTLAAANLRANHAGVRMG